MSEQLERDGQRHSGPPSIAALLPHGTNRTQGLSDTTKPLGKADSAERSMSQDVSILRDTSPLGALCALGPLRVAILGKKVPAVQDGSHLEPIDRFRPLILVGLVECLGAEPVELKRVQP